MPQGGVISPLLANLFLHYAFDLWMRRKWPHLPFERYADDVIVHCRTREEANTVRAVIAARLKECGLELHPEKTKMVYCKDANRRESRPHEKFDFLGFTFRPRGAMNRHGQLFCSFSPGISGKAVQKIPDEIRTWKLHLCSQETIQDLARRINPKLQGWINYYGRCFSSALTPIGTHLLDVLARWAKRKYKPLRRHRLQAMRWLVRLFQQQPKLMPLASWMGSKVVRNPSRVMGDCQARFLEGLGV